MKEKLKEWKNKVLTPERVQSLRDLGWCMFGFCVATGLCVIRTKHSYYLIDRKKFDEWRRTLEVTTF